MNPSEELARRIAIELRARGHSAYLVGGCVRDLLLQLTPKDFDVATSATPPEVLALYPTAQLVGAHFGVALVTAGGASVEVATYRRDHEYRNGRHPEQVTFELDPKQDVLRRDFTINGLLLNPVTGEVLDYVGGRQDLERQLVRAIGDPERRFREDHLRLLRGVRLASKLGFDIESETEAAIVRLHPIVRIVSEERVRDEIVRILTEGGARLGFERLDRTGLLGEILPEAAALKLVPGRWERKLAMLDALRQPSVSLALAVLLEDIDAAATREVLNRLRFSNDEIRRVESLLESRKRFAGAPEMKESELKRLLRLPEFADHLELQRLDCLADRSSLTDYDFVRRRREELAEEEISPARLVTGDDLLALGEAPGPRIGEILHGIEDAQLEGRIRTREEALELALRLLRGS